MAPSPRPYQSPEDAAALARARTPLRLKRRMSEGLPHALPPSLACVSVESGGRASERASEFNGRHPTKGGGGTSDGCKSNSRKKGRKRKRNHLCRRCLRCRRTERELLSTSAARERRPIDSITRTDTARVESESEGIHQRRLVAGQLRTR